MSIAYWCILAAALLPYALTFIAKAGGPDYNNRNPRAWIAKQSGNYRVQRANAAHLNAFEAFAPFAAGVLMAQLAGVDPALVVRLSLAFVAFRVLHAIFYLADKPPLRSLSWLGGFVCVVWLMVAAARHVV
ncbi:MAG: MAPEG family protein [Thermomonas sp.]